MQNFVASVAKDKLANPLRQRSVTRAAKRVSAAAVLVLTQTTYDDGANWCRPQSPP
jgi:hypothetical protein